MAPKRAIDLTVLCYVISSCEYDILHRSLIRRLRRDPQRKDSEANTHLKPAIAADNCYAATIRSSLRLFVGTAAGLKLWGLTRALLLAPDVSRRPRPDGRLSSKPNLRLALSLSSMLFLHRMLHRFFIRLRLRLLEEKARQLRVRYPTLLRGLTSRITPAVGASLAGFALGIYPNEQLRVTIAIYMGARALEIFYNFLTRDGYLSNMPWWFGSWMLFPLAQGQLFHAFLFNRDCLPQFYGGFLLKHTPDYVQRRPPNVARSLRWPAMDQILDSLGEMARLKWPPFISPILHPAHPMPLPATIDPTISPITSRAHPSVSHLSCALIHPYNASCFSAYLSHLLLSFRGLARFFTLFYMVMELPRYKCVVESPVSSFNRLSKSIMKTTAAISGMIGASWGSICLLNAVFPRKFLPKFRIFLAGFLGGCFQFLDRTRAGRVNTLFSARASADSLWKVGFKHGWWKGFAGGDVVVFVIALGLLNVVYELRDKAVEDTDMRMLLRLLRGEVDIGLGQHGKMQWGKEAK